MTPKLKEIMQTVDAGKHLDYLAAASLDEIEEYLQQFTSDSVYRKFALAERQKRHFHVLSKPHWTVLPNFWLTFISAVAAVLAAYFAWRALQPSEPPPHPAGVVPPASSSPMLRPSPSPR